MLVTLEPSAARAIVACMRLARGAEVCGYLMESRSGDQEFLATENRLAARDTCFVSSGDAQRAFRYAAKHDLRVVAFLHSHPADTRLSDVDRLELERSDIPWIIVCLRGMELAAELHPTAE